MHNTFNDTVINAVSQQSWRRWRGILGEWRGTAPPHLRPPNPTHLHQITSMQNCSQVNAA